METINISTRADMYEYVDLLISNFTSDFGTVKYQKIRSEIYSSGQAFNKLRDFISSDRIFPLAGDFLALIKGMRYFILKDLKTNKMGAILMLLRADKEIAQPLGIPYDPAVIARIFTQIIDHGIMPEFKYDRIR